MIDQEALTLFSLRALAQGIRVLQGYRLADTDLEHIEKLLEWMNPKPGTLWIDIGCGFGEPAKLMHQLRPDIDFLLVNNNKFQLEQIPEGLVARNGDMHALPFKDETADGAMFLFSLCHADDPVQALTEAGRVVRPRGRLFVFDYAATDRDELDCPILASRFFSMKAWDRMCHRAGWRLASYVSPPGDDSLFRQAFEDDALYDSIFDQLMPVIWWAA